ncbi:cytidine triphosphate synthetase, partial [Reticulomyxa filosa]
GGGGKKKKKKKKKKGGCQEGKKYIHFYVYFVSSLYVIYIYKGDIESMIFLETLRQLKFDVGSQHFCLIHVSLIPALGADGEMKSKPTQHSVKALREAGLIPDMIVCRSTQPISASIRKKISLFSMVPPDRVLSVHDVPNIYAVPRLLLQQNICSLILQSLHIHDATPPLQVQDFDLLDFKLQHCHEEVVIGIVGKYTGLSDSYISLTKALTTAALACDLKLTLMWIESTDLESLPIVPTDGDLITDPSKELTNEHPEKTKEISSKTKEESEENKEENDNGPLQKYARAWKSLESVDGILIPGGFGDRGIEGKILAIEYARTHKKPFFGICLGMQCAVIEYARHICNLKNANSAEFDPTTQNKVVICMPDISSSHLGGTMRLGAKTCHLQSDSIAYDCYQSTKISERHRHRYEVNPKFVKELESQGLLFTGKDESGERMEIVELPKDKHPFYFACQFHPEFKSGPTRNSPPFLGFIQNSGKEISSKVVTGTKKNDETISDTLAKNDNKGKTDYQK